MKKIAWEHWLGALGLALFAVGSYIGLVVTPPERYMGDVGRILYIHVPTAGTAFATLTLAFITAIGLLKRRCLSWDDVLVAALEVGVLLTALLLVQGSIWAKPTWGVYWTWDPRLTTSAILLLAFIGVLGLRNFVDDPIRRAVWSAVATVAAYVNVPIVYFSVKWWRTLHQPFSSRGTIDPSMRAPLLINAMALLLIATWLITQRARLARLQRQSGHQDAPTPATSALVAGD